MAGDGGMTDWQAIITLNSVRDLIYSYYVQNLIRELFGIRATMSWPNYGERTVSVICSSRNLVDFLNQKGVIRGNKIKQGLRIPSWVRDNPTYVKAFICGLLDTDGCTYIETKRRPGHEYVYIGICIRTFSPPLLNDVLDSLKNLGYHPTASNPTAISLRRELEVIKFLAEIGSHNSRNLKNFKVFMEEYRSGRNGTVSNTVV